MEKAFPSFLWHQEAHGGDTPHTSSCTELSTSQPFCHLPSLLLDHTQKESLLQLAHLCAHYSRIRDDSQQVTLLQVQWNTSICPLMLPAATQSPTVSPFTLWSPQQGMDTLGLLQQLCRYRTQRAGSLSMYPLQGNSQHGPSEESTKGAGRSLLYLNRYLIAKLNKQLH